MKKINLLYTAVIGVTIALSSCNDFLDKMPDSRTEVNNEKKITAILVSAYPQTYPIMSYELASDNTMDNGSNYDPYWKSITQMYRWEDVNEIDDDAWMLKGAKRWFAVLFAILYWLIPSVCLIIRRLQKQM